MTASRKKKEPLPIETLRPRFLEAWQRGPVVLTAPTGSGKSTMVPLWCGGGGARTLVVEPRRVACRALYRFVRRLDEAKGIPVGYMVRHEQAGVDGAQVLYVTPGVALRLLTGDGHRTGPTSLRQFDTVIIDEFHERGLENDLLLALLKERLSASETQAVVMSATIDVDRLSRWLGAQALEGEGRQFPVDVEHLSGDKVPHIPSIRGLEDRVVEGVRQALRRSPKGDILVFLPGKGEIAKSRREVSSALGVETLELHAGLSPRDQDRAFRPPPGHAGRRVILATNVAESSVTLPWVRAVVDSGLEKRTNYRHTRSVLSLMPISSESAAQRAGRAGRLGPGVALRLWDVKGVLRDSTPPEILREDLDSLVLSAAALSRPLGSLDFLDPPDERAAQAAVERLTKMSLLDREGRLTEDGLQATRYPVDPLFSRMLVEAGRQAQAGGSEELLDDTVDLVASLSVQGPLLTRGPRRELHDANKRGRRGGGGGRQKRGGRGQKRGGRQKRGGPGGAASGLPMEPLRGFSMEETEQLQALTDDGVARILAVRGQGPVEKLAHRGRLAEARRIRAQLRRLVGLEGSRGDPSDVASSPHARGSARRESAGRAGSRRKGSRLRGPRRATGSSGVDGEALARLAVRVAPHCAFIRRGRSFGGAGMEVSLSPDSFVDPETPAIAVLDTHSTRTKGFRATHLATCCLPIPSRDLVAQGVGEKHLRAVTFAEGKKGSRSRKKKGLQGLMEALEAGELLAQWVYVYGGQEIHNEERPLKKDESLEAATLLIQEGTVLPGAYERLGDALQHTRLFFESQGGLREELAPHRLSPEVWLRDKLVTLGLKRLEDLALISPEDLLPDLVDAFEMERFVEAHPTRISLRDRTVKVDYDFKKKRATLVHESGRTSPPPSLFQLPKWPGWEVVYQVHSRKWNLKS